MGVLFGLYDALHLSSFISVAISYWVGFAVSFISQKFIVFSNHDKRRHIIAKQLVGYSLLVAWNYVFTLAVIALFSSSVSVFVLRTGAIAVTLLWNFAIYKRLFKTVQG